MKAALGDVPLAIASGITPENVGDYLEMADCFLVATGISKSWLAFDEERVREFVRRVRTY
jgi:predicted TIM-barrel enzyme